MNYNDITMERHCVHSLQKTGIANVKRFFCLFLFLIAFVGNVLAETVTETYTVASTKSFTAGTAFNPTENISLTYGIASDDSRWNVAQHNGSYYAYSSRNPNKSPGVTQGTFLVVNSTIDGAISFDIYMNSDAERYVYVYEENTGSALASVSNGSNGKSNIQLNFNVTAGKNYYIVGAANQNNARYGGYTFTPGGSTGDSDDDSGDDSGDDDDDSGSSSSTWTSTVTGAALDYTIHIPSTQANDQNGEPMTVVYLTNLGFTNISTVSNADNIQWLCDQGYQVIALDYNKNINAVSPKINADIISINNNLKSGTFLEQTCSPLRSYILMEGYRIERDIPYYLDDPTVYNYPDNYTTGDNLYLDLVYPASPSEEVPVLITFAYSNSYDGSEHQRMNLGNTWGNYSDSFVEGAPAVGFAWAVCDHPKYCDWGQGKYTGGANKSLASVEVNPDAACKVKAAIRTVRGKGESLGLNGAVAVTGFSRGSTAASLAVGDGDIDTFEDMTRISNSDYSEQSSKVQCAVLGPGMFDYQTATTSSTDYTNMNNYVSATSASFEQQGALATIQTNASAPTLFYHNTDDYYHPDSKGLYADQATIMKTKLDNLGVTTETITGYSSGHAVPQDETNLNTMYDFLTKHTVLTTSDDDDDSGSTETPEGTTNTLKIDFNNSGYNYDGYTDWTLKEDIESGESESETIDGVTITISHGDNTDAGKIYKSWNKTNLLNGKDYLINDGLTGKGADDEYLKTGKMAIKLSLTGLNPGTHSIQAFHNYPENISGATNPVLPTINVSLGDEVVLSDIPQTFQAETVAESTSTYVTFDVESKTDVIEITYYTAADSHVEYARNNFFINGFILDGSDIDNIAQNPTPANLDWHVADDNGSVTLEWDAPKNGAESYIVYFDTDEEAVTNGEVASEKLQTTSFTKTGLSPLNRYYWRVDVVRDGETYQGDVWSFQPRRLAFPGADGAGKYAVGGRGYNGNGDVYHVTNLNDSGEGSLRYGIENATGPRTIVFDVAGVIALLSDLKCNKPFITVAGQTAPGIGILLRDDSYSADSEDGITRFMRFRFGHGDDWTDESSANTNIGNAAGIQTNFHIMDHCMLGWGSDETFASRGAKNLSFQHNIIGESLNQNGHYKYWEEGNEEDKQHGYAATIGGETGSYHHNLLAHNEGRNWSMAGGLLGNEFAGKMNIYNNVVYNWHKRANDGGTHNGNFVNNYYKMLQGSTNSNTKTIIFEATHEDDYAGTQEYYVAGNVRMNTDGTETPDAEYETYASVLKDGISIDYDDFADTPYNCWSVESKNVSEIESAQSAFKNVLSDVGCNYVQLDNNELRLIKETREGTYTKMGSRSGLLGLIDKESDSEGWNGLGIAEAQRPTGWDSDSDGIPAWFETAMGWSDSSPNNNEDSDGDYYTDLEEYLNWVAEPHFYDMDGDGNVSAIKNGTITLSDYFAGYTSPTYTVADAGGLTVTISDDGTLTYSATQSLASPLVTVKVTATESGISLTREFNIYVEVEIEDEPETVTPEGTVYTLSTVTYTSSSTDNNAIWNFTSNDLDFTITNQNNKSYAYGNENGVKYSAGVQYTIGIPAGIQVDYITFKGYNNYSGTDAYLGELNGTPYNATDYVFPQKEENYTVVEHTIQLTTPATETLTFTPQDKQVVWVITLYTSEVAQKLEDYENTMEETEGGTETVTVEGSVTWKFDEGNNDKVATYSDEIKDYINTASVTLGSKLEYKGTKTVSGITETLLQPTEKTTMASEENAITFSFTTKDDATFTPTNVSYYISRIGTNEGYYLAKINNEVLVESETPARENANPGYTFVDNNIENISEAQTNSLVFNIWNLATSKQDGLANVVITGNLQYQRPTTVTTITLDELATVHEFDAMENVTVNMKRGLTAGAWNTFCVPFSLSKNQLQTALEDDNVEIVEYDRQEGTTLYFENTENIEAGTPYLIKPSTFSRTYSTDMEPIVFENVKLVKATARSNDRNVTESVQPNDAGYAFVGTYVRYIMETDGSELGLNSKNKLAKPSSVWPKNVMRGLRGFFRYNGIDGAGAKVMIGGELTSIDEIDGGYANRKGVYHVSGRYVRSEWNNGSGLPRGLYIVNGQKMVK